MVASEPDFPFGADGCEGETLPERIETRVVDFAIGLFDASVVLLRLPNTEDRLCSTLASTDLDVRAVAEAFLEYVEADEIVLWSASEGEDAVPSFIPQTDEIRFFAGIPVSFPDTSQLGSLCVLDETPRTISPMHRRWLVYLRDMIGRDRRRREGQARLKEADACEIGRQNEVSRQLEETNRRLRLALEAADAGTFVFDVAAEEVEWDQRTLDIYGLEGAARRVEASRLYEFVHPDDKAHLADVFYGAVEQEGGYEVTYRIFRPDGEERVIHSHGIVVRDETGTANRVVGINRDVTERRQLEQEVLSISEEERRRIGQHLHDTLGGNL